MKSYDYFDLLLEQQEPLNVTLGRLRIAIKLGNEERQMELVEKISRNIIGRQIID